MNRTGDVLLLSALLIGPFPVNAQSPSCPAPGDSSAAQLASLNDVMRASNAAATNLRTTIGVAGLDTADVRLVTDDSLCARIDSTMMTESQPPVWQTFVVYMLGARRYAAFIPGPKYTTVFFVDDRNQVLAMLR